MRLSLQKVRQDFPLVAEGKVHYLDSACMSLKPRQVIEKEEEYYLEYPACVGRSHHRLGEEATEAVDDARSTIRKFIGAKHAEEVVFSKNTTESINLVAMTSSFKKGDVVLTSDKEHNSNLLPWQRLARIGIVHAIVKTNEDNTFSIANLQSALREYKGRVKMAAFGMTSNLDGVTIPAKDVTRMCHEAGTEVLLDAAQMVPHQEVDVRRIGCDYLAFSGHKMCGPTGTGVLYGRRELLEKREPFLIGGETVTDSTYTTYKEEILPQKLEAGLQHYAGMIGLGEACKYLAMVGRDTIAAHERELNVHLTRALQDRLDNGRLELIGPKDPKLRGGIFNFTIKGFDAHEAAIMLDKSRNVMVRSGAHCVHSWYHARKKPISVRASWYMYNTLDDLNALVAGVEDILKMVQ